MVGSTNFNSRNKKKESLGVLCGIRRPINGTFVDTLSSQNYYHCYYYGYYHIIIDSNSSISSSNSHSSIVVVIVFFLFFFAFFLFLWFNASFLTFILIYVIQIDTMVGGHTALDVACHEGHCNIIRELIERGADKDKLVSCTWSIPSPTQPYLCPWAISRK